MVGLLGLIKESNQTNKIVHLLGLIKESNQTNKIVHLLGLIKNQIKPNGGPMRLIKVDLVKECSFFSFYCRWDDIGERREFQVLKQPKCLPIGNHFKIFNHLLKKQVAFVLTC